MNAPFVHLALNHIPLIGLFFAIALLAVVAWTRRSRELTGGAGGGGPRGSRGPQPRPNRRSVWARISSSDAPCFSIWYARAA